MTDAPRGPTTEELRARVLAQTPNERSAPMRYCVNATLTVPAYLYVEADSPDAALAEAREHGANAFETDMGAAEVDFNVTPPAEVVTAA